LRASLIALSVATVMGTGGCSWIFVKPLPPNYDIGSPVDCTADATAPVVDTLFALSNAAGFVYWASKSNSQNSDGINVLITADVLGFLLWGASAIYGYDHASSCSAARRDARLSYPHHLGVQHRPYLPTEPVGPPPPAPPSAATPAGPQPAPVITPLRAPAPQRGDDEKPSVHSPPPPKPWTLPQED
jgi:hypothetical protein